MQVSHKRITILANHRMMFLKVTYLGAQVRQRGAIADISFGSIWDVLQNFLTEGATWVVAGASPEWAIRLGGYIGVIEGK